jgi:alcohol dehydrogenase class IV
VSPLIRFGPGGLADLGELARELGLERLLLVTTPRFEERAPALPVAGVYAGVRPHVPVETVREAAALALALEADGLVALGGGSAVDTCKAVTAELLGERELRTIAVPTTYAGAEWTSFYGVLQEPGRKGGGADDRVRPVAAVYDPELQLGLPRAETVGTAMNALAHCAEAYYAPGRSERAARNADCGAVAIGYALPLVVAGPSSLYARTRLLEGAMRAALALGEAGLALAHALAQALGGRYGLPHGAMNALCLAPALRFNAAVVPEEVARFGRALRTDDAPARVEELARLGGYERLRDFGVPEDGLEDVAAAAAARGGARANPRQASAAEIEELLRSIW